MNKYLAVMSLFFLTSTINASYIQETQEEESTRAYLNLLRSFSNVSMDDLSDYENHRIENQLNNFSPEYGRFKADFNEQMFRLSLELLRKKEIYKNFK